MKKLFLNSLVLYCPHEVLGINELKIEKNKKKTKTNSFSKRRNWLQNNWKKFEGPFQNRIKEIQFKIEK